MRKRLLQGSALFALNVFLCFPLFRVEYLDDLQSTDGWWMALARFLTEHWPRVRWVPLQDGGMPLESAYLPLIQTVTALASVVAHVSPALAFHFLTALAYSLAPVGLFFFVSSLAGRTTAAFSAALIWSLFSPSVLLPKILEDTGTPWALRRLRDIVFFGEAPHNVAFALVPLALLLLARFLKEPGSRRFAAAVLALAAVMTTNAFGIVLVGVSAVLLAASADRVQWREFLWVGAMVAAAYLLICRALPPSLIQLMTANSQTSGGDFRFTWTSALLAAAYALALGAVWWGTRRLRGPMLRFSILLMAGFGGIPLLGVWGLSFLPQPFRYHAEMEIGICLVAGFAVEAIAQRLHGKAMAAAAAVCAAFLIWVGAKDYAYARRLIRPMDITRSAPYREARWITDRFPGQRVMASGESSLWFNVFSDNPQLSGGHEPSAPNWMQLVAVYTIYTGQNAGARDGEISVFWLKAFGCAAITVPRLDSPAFFHPIRNPAKFDGLLPLVWREGADSIYQVPLRSASLAHVIPRSAMVSRRPVHGLDIEPARAYVDALDDPRLPAASLEWVNPERGRIVADIADGQAVAVQVTYDPGWQATREGRPLRVLKDGLGLMVIEPGAAGRAQIELSFEGGVERGICSAISVATALGLLVMLGWRRRRSERSGGKLDVPAAEA